MYDDSRKRLKRATIVFWILLLYIITALIWWFFILERQNRQIYQLQKEQISVADKNSPQYKEEIRKIEKLQNRNTAKYVGEGIIFLLLIIFGAVFIYRSVRRQFRMQQQQQNFVMAITHELKTPISIAKLNLETLLKHKLDEAMEQKLLQSSLTETVRLDTLINNILVLSQLDSGYNFSKEKLNLADLLNETIRDFKNRYSNREIISEVEPGIKIKGDPLLLKLMVSNLLENANKYSEKDTIITCTLINKSNNFYLQVKDEGAGIAEEEKKLIFDKFYRIGNEQTRKTQGTGLGLYLCKKIAQAHGGDIEVKNNNPQGSIFTIYFPGNKN